MSASDLKRTFGSSCSAFRVTEVLTTAESTGILIRHINAKGLLLIPPPYSRTRSVGNESRRVEVIRMMLLRLWH
jgi:hypothetical protein